MVSNGYLRVTTVSSRLYLLYPIIVVSNETTNKVNRHPPPTGYYDAIRTFKSDYLPKFTFIVHRATYDCLP